MFKKRVKLPQFNKSRAILISIIFLISYFSGSIEILGGASAHGLTLREIEREYVAEASADSGRMGSVKKRFDENRYFLKSAVIGQRKEAVPTTTQAPANNSGQTWGVATKIGEHTYTMQVQNDEHMASAHEIHAALNNYRKQHGRNDLAWDEKLASFATSRAEYFVSSGTLDGHKGFLDYLNNQDGFKTLGFSSLGENSSYGFKLNGVHMIEWVYAGDEEHNSNQLSSEWQYVGIGVKDTATNLVFGGSRL